jgi:peptide/nickel transport system permease protein
MKKYVISRFIKLLLTIWFVWTLVFVLVRISGDPVQIIFGDDPSSEKAVESLTKSLGLDLPIWKQYIKSFIGIFKGDAGSSYYYNKPVAELFKERAWASISLSGISVGLGLIIGVLLGVFAAINRQSVFDRVTVAVSVLGYTVPNFVLGIMLIFVFSLKLKVLPSGSTGTWWHYIMPVITLASGHAATITRLTRTSILEVIQMEYLDFARSKGISEKKVIFKHALRNALIPVVTMFGTQLSVIVGGAVVVENVFAWPGFGTLIISAAKKRDFPIVQFGVLLIVIFVSVVSFLVDLSYGLLDPRIRDARDGKR